MTKVFHLYLSTKITSPTSNLVVPMTNPITSTNLNNISWMVDWDSLFRGWNKKYKRCIVRLYLNSDSYGTSPSDFENYSGVLACNLPSDAGSSTNYGTALTIYYPVDTPSANSNHCFILNTMDQQQGVEVLIPTGVSPFTISWLKANGSMGLNTNSMYDYQVLFQFELSDPIE